jgi:hypothetical protein
MWRRCRGLLVVDVVEVVVIVEFENDGPAWLGTA